MQKVQIASGHWNHYRVVFNEKWKTKKIRGSETEPNQNGYQITTHGICLLTVDKKWVGTLNVSFCQELK